VASGWTDAELEACVLAYFEVAEAHASGQPVNKTDLRNRVLAGPLAGRTKGSYEYRMQNISHVLQVDGQPWVEGFRPAANVGAGIVDRIRTLLDKHRTRVIADDAGPAPTDDPDELDQRTRDARRGRVGLRPPGQQTPQRTTRSVEAFVRDPLVRAAVLSRAAGVCELCEERAPFLDKHGDPFLEVHHVRMLAKGGSDTIGNAAALCPNCHRRLHLGADAAEQREQLYCGLPALRRE